VILNLVLAEIAIMGSTAVADFDLQPSFTAVQRKKERISSQIGLLRNETALTNGYSSA
jgi:hypothetical protein